MTAVDTGHLLKRAAAGDIRARDDLLRRHRSRLRRMVAVRADPRLAARRNGFLGPFFWNLVTRNAENGRLVM
jgi:hypothetical protein